MRRILLAVSTVAVLCLIGLLDIFFDDGCLTGAASNV